jgi:hypothetical protein
MHVRTRVHENGNGVWRMCTKYIWTHTCTCMRMHMNIDAYIHKHIHIDAYIHTKAHTLIQSASTGMPLHSRLGGGHHAADVQHGFGKLLLKMRGDVSGAEDAFVRALIECKEHKGTLTTYAVMMDKLGRYVVVLHAVMMDKLGRYVVVFACSNDG